MTSFRNTVLVFAATCLSVFGADPALVNLIPSDARFVAGIHADQIKNSRFGQYLLDQMKSEENNFSKLIAQTGFDPRRDLSEIIVASSDPQNKNHNSLVIARGRFDATRINAFVRQSGAGQTSYQGIDIVTDSRHENAEAWMAVLNPSLVVAGGSHLVKQAIDQNRQGGRLQDAKMAGRIAELSGRYDAWIVTSNLDGMPVKMGKLDPNLVQSMDSMMGGVRFGTNVELMAEAAMRSEKDAGALADVVRFLAGMVQLNREKDPKSEEMANLLEKIDIKATGNQLRLLLTVPEDYFEKYVKPARHRRRGDPVI